ncbi:galanin receptor 2a-like [Asterias amurensis]|uniref:galanin receptor 2a-like n=1 Tax=Asterias amurensis TaxID=7602 RepID=UPI003AB5E1F1
MLPLNHNDDGVLTTTAVSWVLGSKSVSLNTSDEDVSSSDYSYSWSSLAGINSQEGLDTWIPIVLFTLMFLVGVPANAVILFVLLRNGICRTNINLFLLNLALVDFIFLVFKVPLKLNSYIVSSRIIWSFGTVVCKLSTYLLYVNMTVSILTLVALAVNRYNAVMRPVSSRSKRSKAHAILMIVLIWVIALASQSPALAATDTITINMIHDRVPTVICAESWSSYTPMRIFKGSNFIFFYCIPLAVVTVCYLRMARTLQRSAQFTRNESGDSAMGVGLQRQQSCRRKVARMVHVLVVAFAVCMLPWHIYMLISCSPSITPDAAVHFYIGILCRWAVYLNSCLNPVLYSFFSQNFRVSLKKSFCCWNKVLCRKRTFIPIKTGIKGVAEGMDESGRNFGSSSQQRSFTTVLMRAC